MSLKKQKRNQDLLKKLSCYLEKTSPEKLFSEIEGRYPNGEGVEDFLRRNENMKNYFDSSTRD